MATGGQSLWVQAVVMGTGYTVSGEGYDYANVGFDLDKFFAMKGVDNPGEYLGGVIFDAAKDSGMMFGGMKLNEWLKGRKATANNGANGAEISYDSFNAFKKANPVQTQGNHWHHIVEQSQQQKSGFSVQQINNTNNLIELTPSQHSQITGYYNTKSFQFTNGLSVRDWLAGQSFETQYQFGIEKLKEFGFMK